MGEQRKIREEFPDEKLMALEVTDLPWYADIVNYFVSSLFQLGATSHQRKKFNNDARFYLWDEAYLFKQGLDKMMEEMCT